MSEYIRAAAIVEIAGLSQVILYYFVIFISFEELIMENITCSFSSVSSVMCDSSAMGSLEASLLTFLKVIKLNANINYINLQ